MESETAELSPEAAHAASDSLGGATGVADRVGGAAGRALSASAETAFTGAMSTSLVVASGVAMAGAVLAFIVLPKHRRRQPETADAGVPEAAAA